MHISKTIVLFLAAAFISGDASAASLGDKSTFRQKAAAICYDDATRLCGDFVPDEDKVAACMKAKRSQLGAPCLKIFDEGTKAAGG